MKVSFEDVAEGDVVCSGSVLLRVIKREPTAVTLEDMSEGYRWTYSKSEFAHLHAEKR